MTTETHLFSNGSWRKAKQVYVRSSGNWVECKEVWTKKDGVWRLVFSKAFILTDTIVNGYDYNVYNTAMNTGQWDGATPVIANITVAGTLGSSVSTTYDWQGYINLYSDLQAPASTYNNGPVAFAKYHYYSHGIGEGRTMPLATSAPYAFSSGPLPAGSVINLTVTGGSILSGSGGIGGFGGMFNVRTNDHAYTPSTGGFPGGPAIFSSVPITIINNGTIAGGGGGGGGGSGAGGNEAYDDPGAAGGGGAGNIVGLQGGSFRSGTFIGQNGTALSGGAGGTISNQGSGQWAGARNGGRGGDLGQAGTASPPGAGTFDTAAGFPGGAAGLAVQGIANVTWQVFGDVRGPTA